MVETTKHKHNCARFEDKLSSLRRFQCESALNFKQGLKLETFTNAHGTGHYLLKDSSLRFAHVHTCS